MKEHKNPHALMTLLSIETGQRAGELAALQKSDDLGKYLHVHRQQIKRKDKDGHQIFYDVGYTKDERFHPHNGRLIPNAGKYWIWQKLFPEILNISFIIKRENLFRGILIFRIWGVVVRD